MCRWIVSACMYGDEYGWLHVQCLMHSMMYRLMSAQQQKIRSFFEGPPHLYTTDKYLAMYYVVWHVFHALCVGSLIAVEPL